MSDGGELECEKRRVNELEHLRMRVSEDVLELVAVNMGE